MKLHEYDMLGTLDLYGASDLGIPLYPDVTITDAEIAAIHERSASYDYSLIAKHFYAQYPFARWMFSPEPPDFMQPMVDKLVNSVEAREVSVLDAVTFACNLGYVAIGGVQSRWIYNPADFSPPKTRYESEDGTWIEHDKPEFTPGKVRALTCARAAMLGAMFGDPLNRSVDNRREGLAELDLPTDRSPYGWTVPWPPVGSRVNVCHELQNFAMRERLTGAIDLLWGGSFENENFIMLESSRAHATRVTFPVSWRELPFAIATDPVFPNSPTLDDPRWIAQITAIGCFDDKISASTS